MVFNTVAVKFTFKTEFRLLANYVYQSQANQVRLTGLNFKTLIAFTLMERVFGPTYDKT